MICFYMSVKKKAPRFNEPPMADQHGRSYSCTHCSINNVLMSIHKPAGLAVDEAMRKDAA